jgi:hypothetical protein
MLYQIQFFVEQPTASKQSSKSSYTRLLNRKLTKFSRNNSKLQNDDANSDDDYDNIEADESSYYSSNFLNTTNVSDTSLADYTINDDSVCIKKFKSNN